jgi:glutamate synthase domain-containing protein 1
LDMGSSRFVTPQHASGDSSRLSADTHQPLANGLAGLYDPRFEHESCGVGFVATLTDIPSRAILDHALQALSRLAHRGAIAADGLSSDGIGICTAIPREVLLRSAGISLAPEEPLAVGVVFFPADAEESHTSREEALAAQGFTVLGWRPRFWGRSPARPCRSSATSC